MSGIAGNVYTLSIAKQTAKGAAATASTGYKLKLTGGDVSPQRQLLTLQETDASRQQGNTVVVGATVSGTPEWYVRPSDFGLISFLALGAHSVTGAGPYVHTATPANQPPYATVWKNVGAGTIIDQYVDCRVGSLELSGGAGQALSCKADIMGLSAVFGATDNSTAVVSEIPYTYPMVTCTIGGSAPATVENFTITINNNLDFIQADTQLGPYDVVPGRLEVSGSFTYLLQNDQDYRNFHTGSPTGTAFSAVLDEQSFDVAITDGTNIIEASMAGVAFTAFPVQPDVSGKPIRVAATFTSLPQTLISDYISIVTTNGVVTY